MKNNWSPKKIKEKDPTYFLIEDILSCFPDNVKENLISVLNRHRISKEFAGRIFKAETKNKKPNFHILAGVLILQNDHLRRSPSSAFYEAIEVIPELKYCFKNDSRKTIKRLSAQTILRLFAILYLEFVIMPGREGGGRKYIDRFKEFFTKEDMREIINRDMFYTQLIFQRLGIIDLGVGINLTVRLKDILNEFYYSDGK
jgi:hypothetical protein